MNLRAFGALVPLVGLLLWGCGGMAKTDSGQPLSRDGYAALEAMVQVRSAVAQLSPRAGVARTKILSRACNRIRRYSDIQARDVLAACEAGTQFERNFYVGLNRCNHATNRVACETTAVQASVTDESDLVAALNRLSARLKHGVCRHRLVDAPRAADRRLESALAALASALRNADTGAARSAVAALQSASIATSQAARQSELQLPSCRP